VQQIRHASSNRLSISPLFSPSFFLSSLGRCLNMPRLVQFTHIAKQTSCYEVDILAHFDRDLGI